METQELPEEEQQEVEEAQQALSKVSKRGLLDALAAAVATGQVDSRDARRLRSQIGITQSYFTRKQTTKAYRKSRRLMQRDSRRQNRGLGKGQKRTK